MADPNPGLLDDIWNGWSNFWDPKQVAAGAPYSPETLGLARSNAIGNLGGTLLALSQGGLSPEFRAQLLARVGDAGTTYQQTLGEGVKQRLSGAQASEAEQRVASQKSSDNLFDAEIARRSGGGGVAAAPAVTPGNLPVAPAISTALASLKGAESGGNPALVNKQGYSGLYQMGTGLAHAAGIYKPAADEATTDEKGRAVNSWRGQWTVPGFPSMSHEEFLRNPDAQQRAAELAMKYNADQIQQSGLDKYVGQTVNGVQITPEGLLQGAWLGGVHGLKKWLTGQGDPADASGTAVSRWAALTPPRGTTVATNTTTSAPAATSTDTPVVAGAPLKGTTKVGGLADLTPQQLALLRSMPYAERAQWLLQQSQAQYPRLLTDNEVVSAGFPKGTVVQLGPNGLQVVQENKATSLLSEDEVAKSGFLPGTVVQRGPDGLKVVQESKTHRLLSPDEVAKNGFPTGTIVQQGPDGLKVVQESKNTQLLSPDEVAKNGFPTGTIVQRGPNGLTVVEQSKTSTQLTPDEVAKAGFPPGTIVQRGPGGVLSVVQQSATNLTTEQKQRHEDELRTRLETGNVYTNYTQAQPSIQAIRQAYATKDPAGRGAADLDMIIGYAKLLDPNSVVRESEGDNVRKIGGTFDWLSTLVDNIRNGAKLDDNTRAQILHSAESRWKSYEDPYRNRVNQYRTFATQYGLEPDRVAPALGDPTSKYEAPADAPKLSDAEKATVLDGLKQKVASRQLTRAQAGESATRAGIDPNLLDK